MEKSASNQVPEKIRQLLHQNHEEQVQKQGLIEWDCFCAGSTNRSEGRSGTKEGAMVSWPTGGSSRSTSPKRKELASLSTGLRTVRETKRSSVLSRSSALRFAQDLSERQSISLFQCIDGAEWDDI